MNRIFEHGKLKSLDFKIKRLITIFLIKTSNFEKFRGWPKCQLMVRNFFYWIWNNFLCIKERNFSEYLVNWIRELQMWNRNESLRIFSEKMLSTFLKFKRGFYKTLIRRFLFATKFALEPVNQSSREKQRISMFFINWDKVKFILDFHYSIDYLSAVSIFHYIFSFCQCLRQSNLIIKFQMYATNYRTKLVADRKNKENSRILEHKQPNFRLVYFKLRFILSNDRYSLITSKKIEN